MFWTILMEVSLGQICYDTVDGRNPAPVDKYFIPLWTVFYTSQVISRISEPSTVLYIPSAVPGYFLHGFLDLGVTAKNRLMPFSKWRLQQHIGTFGGWIDLWIYLLFPKQVTPGFVYIQWWWSYRTWRLRAGELCGRGHPSWAIVMGS